MKNLDEKDKKILEMLLVDSRRPYHEIANEVGLSESTVRKRVIRLKEDGIIEKFTIKLCPEDEECICAFLTIIPVSEAEIKALLREMLVIPQCVEVYKMAGQCGILVKVHVPNVNELDAMIELFQGRTDVKTVERVCVVLKPVKSQTSNGTFPL